MMDIKTAIGEFLNRLDDHLVSFDNKEIYPLKMRKELLSYIEHFEKINRDYLEICSRIEE